jgi:acyl-CoA dehydrogenase
MSVTSLPDLSARLVRFMDQHIYPNESRYAQEIAADRRRPSPLIEELKPVARAAGLWNLFIPNSPHS